MTIFSIDESGKATRHEDKPLDSEKELEDFLEQHPQTLQDDMFIIGRQVATVDGKFIDLLGIDNCFHVFPGAGHTPHAASTQYYDTTRAVTVGFTSRQVCPLYPPICGWYDVDSPPPIVNTCPADIVADGVITVADILEILGQFGCVTNCFADVDDDVADFHEGIDSFLSTISYFYYAILLFSIVTLIISVMQFFDKPWGTKALLGSTGLLLVLLLATGAYEASSFVEISEDYEEITDEPLGDMPSFFEVNGTMGGYCAGLCFGVYALLAYFGRPKSPPVQLVMN